MRRRSAVKLATLLALACSVGLAAFAANRPLSHQGLTHHGEARLTNVFHWQGDQWWFGGFSGIELSPDGSAMIALSDRATLVQASLQRQDGEISDIEITAEQRLHSSRGRLLQKKVADSEGLAITADGSLYVSFEGVSRIARHRLEQEETRVLPRAKPFRHLPVNKALEALAIDNRGRLYTLPERAFTSDGQIPVWRWNGNTWQQPFTLSKRGRFLPVGADFGPDGKFYLLERSFSFFGFRSRLRRWTLSAEGVKNEQVLLETRLGTHDNLEGVSIWRSAQGQLMATMISDDNFLSLQRTELVEYALPN